MNRYQKAIAVMASLNLLLLTLFPPFLDSPLQRGIPPSFEGFYFLFMAPFGRRIDESLLTMEIILVLCNALAAWLAVAKLDRKESPQLDFSIIKGLALFGIANLTLIFLFPPFEPYPSSFSAFRQNGFDGFYFVLGDKRNRHLFAPLLYLEVIFVAVNLLSAWLIFGLMRNSQQSTPAGRRPDADDTPSAEPGVQRSWSAIDVPNTYRRPPQPGRGGDRRQRQDPNFSGPERRSGGDRRRRRNKP